MSNPEDAVLAAIDGLELDEVGQIVKWQLEEGMARGEHLLNPRPGYSSIGRPYSEAFPTSADPYSHRAMPAFQFGQRWRTWNEDWDLVSDTTERPTSWTEGHYVTVEREGVVRWSGRVSSGRPVRDVEFLRPVNVWANPWLPYQESFPTAVDPAEDMTRAVMPWYPEADQ